MAPRPDPIYQRLGWRPVRNPTGRVRFVLRGRNCYIDPLFVPLWTQIERALDDTDYENPCDWIGIHKYRVVAGTNQLSRHSYTPGIAFDLDYGGDTDGDGDPTIDRNPHLHRKIVESDYGNTIQLLRHQVDAVLSIRTVSGAQALRWLGDRNGDSMHFDTICSPLDIASGIVPYERGADTVPTWKIHAYARDPLGTWNRFARLFNERNLIVDPDNYRDMPDALIAFDAVRESDAAETSATLYWFDKLDNPEDPEWSGFLARTELETWARSVEQGG